MLDDFYTLSISTPAPAWDATDISDRQIQKGPNFNSRTRVGVRRQHLHMIAVLGPFQLTHPVGDATSTWSGDSARYCNFNSRTP